jgi:hypothetical protein
MLDLFFHLYQNRWISDVERTALSAENQATGHNFNIKELEKETDMLKLVNQAMFEIMVERFGVSEEDILRKIEEIDLRDGVKDGKLGNSSLYCKKCRRGYNVRLNKCLYCGHVDSAADELIVNKYGNSKP